MPTTATAERIREIQSDFLDHRLSLPEAVEALDDAVEGITRVDFRVGESGPQRFSVTNHQAVYHLPVAGLRRKHERRMYVLAIGAYQQAQRNGSVCPGGVHISRNLSTKHHRRHLYDYARRYA